jgi:hypothetical protein
MHSFAALRRLFLSIAGSTSAMGLFSVTACGGTSTSGIDKSQMMADVCEGLIYQPLVGISPGEPVDFLELMEQDESNSGMHYDTFHAVARLGSPCGGASDPHACMSALELSRSIKKGWFQLPREGAGWFPPLRHLVYTRKDEVAVLTTIDELTTFLAPIESAKDAAFLVTEGSHERDGGTFSPAHRISCGILNVRQTSSGFELVTQSGRECGGIYENLVSVSSAGALDFLSRVRIGGDIQCTTGRRPQGFAARRSPQHHSRLGKYFAELAELEAASVVAFRYLAKDLSQHGAPATLVKWAHRSRREEMRHTAQMTAFARRFGGRPSAPTVAPWRERALCEIALENATEGCIRETFGALQATVQAQKASDPAILRAFGGIAEDETHHAALAWAIAEWLEPKLTPEERRRITRARREAVDSLASDLEQQEQAEVSDLAGAPSRAENRRLLEAVHSHLWV